MKELERIGTMAKRFTDSNKWEDDWFASLPPKYKLFWLYLCDRCDHAGVWKISAHVAQALIGEAVDLKEAQELFKGRVEAHEGFWWLKKFCQFQYGELKTGNKTHESVLKILRFQGLKIDSLGISENLGESQNSHAGVKDKDMVKDRDKEEDFNRFWNICSDKRGKEDARKAWVKLKDEEKLEAIRARPIYDAEQKRKGTEQQYIKSPGPWLTSKRWEEIAVGAGACQHDWRKVSQGMDAHGNLSFKLKCGHCGKIK